MDAKTIAWVSYITFIGWIIAFVSHSNALIKSSFAVFHLRQSLGLMVTYLVIWILGSVMLFTIPLMSMLMWLVYVVLLVLWLIGLISALNGEEKPLPVIGPLFQQWFSFIR